MHPTDLRAPSRNRWHVLRQRTYGTEFQNILMPTDSPTQLKNPDPEKSGDAEFLAFEQSQFDTLGGES